MSTSERQKLREWREIAEARGWRVTVAGNGHLKWWRPDGTLATVTPGTPNGGNRSIDNSRAKLRRAGLRGIK